MACVLGFLLVFVLLAGYLDSSAGAVRRYTVTLVSCTQGSTCPQGNYFGQTYALNGTINPNLQLRVGDRLVFLLATNVPYHPLTICRNRASPYFCQGAGTNETLNRPITQAGSRTVVTFTTAGTYYYGCLYHTGMGARIQVTRRASGWSAIGTHPTTGNLLLRRPILAHLINHLHNSQQICVNPNTFLSNCLSSIKQMKLTFWR